MYLKNEGLNVAMFEYDFEKDGGAQGEIKLTSKGGKSVLPVGAIIKGVTAKVLTAITSAGSATLAWGNGDDADGFSGTAIGKASLLENVLFNGWDGGAALLWDDTNDHPIFVNVSTVDDGEFNVTIGTADITAGKVLFFVDFYYPKEVA